jgi:N-glycosylase/DNA lyase
MRLALCSPLAGASLAETLDGGQCFRWQRTEDGRWCGVSGTVAAELRESSNAVEARLLAGSAEDLATHLGAKVDWLALVDALPWRSDAHLARCVTAFPGLRILRQPFGEALLCFLCSATKQITQIKQIVALLAERFGCELAPGLHALPTWSELAGVDEAELRRCRLGFRARHIAAIARRFAAEPGWLEDTAALPYPAAKARLLELPGVGEKIADCVLLFGAGCLEAFPVDVWILRAMERHYGLAGWNAAQIAHFGRVHFGELAGLAQQFLFAWERATARGGGQIRNAATQAVSKHATVPPTIALKASEARFARCAGTSAPMPPTWMPIETRLANPHSA